MFTFFMYIAFIILLGTTSYYTVLYTQLHESIVELSNKIESKCGSDKKVTKKKKHHK